ncbi:MAG: site-specific DNA-methyltransferase [Candidatus Margulisbacteria bacterium]|jgi:DNA modification methylase|nr:site-specific DNA-methyltransferase [Candidatus Margulisiibacteriota bacterium]
MIEPNNIYLGDCLALLDDLQDNSVDCLITDPPYSIITKYTGGWDLWDKNFIRNIAAAGLDNFTPRDFLQKIKTKLKKFNAYIFSSKNLLPQYMDFASSNNYNWDLLVYGKNNPIPGKNNKYLPDREFIMYIRDKGATFDNNQPYDFYRGIKLVNVHKPVYGHPTEKNAGVISQLMSISSVSGDTILDPFLGSGTTAAVCYSLNRKYIGVEINPEYFEAAKQRIADLKIQPALF